MAEIISKEVRGLLPCNDCNYSSICKYAFPGTAFKLPEAPFNVTITCNEKEKINGKRN